MLKIIQVVDGNMTIRSKSTAANASNFVRSVKSSDGLYIGLLKYGTGPLSIWCNNVTGGNNTE